MIGDKLLEQAERPACLVDGSSVEVELHLIGGKSIRGTMFLAPMQRLSDYLHHGGKFAGIARATLHPDGKQIGDVAVNTGAISMIREAKGEEE